MDKILAKANGLLVKWLKYGCNHYLYFDDDEIDEMTSIMGDVGKEIGKLERQILNLSERVKKLEELLTEAGN